MSVFNLTEEDIKPSTRVCCRHFPDGDPKKRPDVTLGTKRTTIMYIKITPFFVKGKEICISYQARSEGKTFQTKGSDKIFVFT